MKPKHGEVTAPIFPIQDMSKCQWPGMRELDLFAAMAMIGLLANEGRISGPVAIAQEAVAQAKALLAALEKDVGDSAEGRTK